MCVDGDSPHAALFAISVRAACHVDCRKFFQSHYNMWALWSCTVAGTFLLYSNKIRQLPSLDTVHSRLVWQGDLNIEFLNCDKPDQIALCITTPMMHKLLTVSIWLWLMLLIHEDHDPKEIKFQFIGFTKLLQNKSHLLCYDIEFHFHVSDPQR